MTSETPALDKITTQVPDTAIKQIIPEPVQLNIDFESTAENYWVTNFPKIYNDYIKGSTAGKFGKNDMSLDTVFTRINALIKELSLMALSNKQMTGEVVKNNLEIINLSLKCIANSINIENKEQVKNLYAYMHGYITSVIKTSKLKE